MTIVVDLTDEQIDQLAPLLGTYGEGEVVFAQIFADGCMRVDVFNAEIAVRMQAAIGRFKPEGGFRRYSRDE